MSTNIYLLLPSFSVDKGDSNVENAFFVNYAMPCFDFRALFHFLFDLHELTKGESSIIYYYSGIVFAGILEMMSQMDDIYPSLKASLMRVMINLDARKWEDNPSSPTDYEISIGGVCLRNNIVSEATFRLERSPEEPHAILDLFATTTPLSMLHFSHTTKYSDNTILFLKPSLYDVACYLVHNRGEDRVFQHNPKHPIVSSPRPPINGVSFLSCSEKVAQRLIQYAFGNPNLLCAFDCRVSNYKAFRNHRDIYWHAHDISEEELLAKNFSRVLLDVVRQVAKNAFCK